MESSTARRWPWPPRSSSGHFGISSSFQVGGEEEMLGTNRRPGEADTRPALSKSSADLDDGRCRLQLEVLCSATEAPEVSISIWELTISTPYLAANCWTMSGPPGWNSGGALTVSVLESGGTSG